MHSFNALQWTAGAFCVLSSGRDALIDFLFVPLAGSQGAAFQLRQFQHWIIWLDVGLSAFVLGLPFFVPEARYIRLHGMCDVLFDQRDTSESSNCFPWPLALIIAILFIVYLVRAVCCYMLCF
jgi:hypothetical protein